MKNKSIGVVGAILVTLSLFFPQTALAAPTTIDGRTIEPHDGLTIKPNGDVIIDISKYEIHGNTISITDDFEVISYYGEDSFRTTPSRGCTDKQAACWTGGTALGDMQFTGTGVVRGNWPARNRFYTGNKRADVTFHDGRREITINGLHAWWWVDKVTAGVDGKMVNRYT